MPASVALSKHDVNYLEKCSMEIDLNFGIIISQQLNPESFLVVHLAKNCEEDMELLQRANENELIQGPTCIQDISTQALATQWISASKMCPGSFSVQGVFVTIDKQNIDEEVFVAAKKLMYDIHNILLQGNNFCASFEEENSSLIFWRILLQLRKLCLKLIHITIRKGGSFLPMNCHFMDKSVDWHTFECCYELDDIFPIFDDTQKINIENQFQRAILAMKRSLSGCEMFVENVALDDSLSLEGFVANNRNRKATENYKATIFLPLKCHQSNEYSVKVRKFNGTIRLSAARIQVYCDGLTDPHVNNDAVFISEPPRRVFFNLFSDVTLNPIQFSEYIFRGEAPTVAVAQAKQVLDLDISLENIVADLEGLPDDEIFSDVSISSLQDTSAPTIVNSAKYLTRSMYMLSIVISLLVLLCSIWLHYFFP
ncbi:unnamed protein product [Ceratitis capitata]|uniref:(Mediterranean fruit fly) hypothetical protein n=1 Tax=Ceratitis capitata TaxID=7213 RepID=A0A811UWP0_CERCA|nr:unnamed protein product [Ceratitis capitata]